jgi:hypothetical protein
VLTCAASPRQYIDDELLLVWGSLRCRSSFITAGGGESGKPLGDDEDFGVSRSVCTASRNWPADLTITSIQYAVTSNGGDPGAKSDRLRIRVAPLI